MTPRRLNIRTTTGKIYTVRTVIFKVFLNEYFEKIQTFFLEDTFLIIFIPAGASYLYYKRAFFINIVQYPLHNNIICFNFF